MKIYFDKLIIIKYNKGWIPFLYPILGEVKKENRHGRFYDATQVKKWIEEGKKLISFEKDVSKCDYMVFPIKFSFSYLEILEHYCKIGKEYNKKVIIFIFNDNEQPIPNKYGNLIVFRVSLNKNSPNNEFAMPGFTDDLGNIYGIKEKIEDLSISYCGYVGYYNIKSFIEYIDIKIKFLLFDNKFISKLIFSFVSNNKWLTKFGIFLEKLKLIYDGETFRDSLLYYFFAKGKGIIYRSEIIKKLGSINTKTNIIKRSKMLTPSANLNLKDEYVTNIKTSLFPLVIRGNGNYSYRLSEVLSLGKIPLFIDTNCRLPFETIVDYKNLFCWCAYDSIEEIEKTILSFYKNHDLDALQGKMREIYEQYFSFLGFHKNIVKMLMS